MSNLSELTKLFYSQGYLNIYDDGEPINIDSSQINTEWVFYIHGIDHESLDELEEEDAVDEEIYHLMQLRHSFSLESFHRLLRDFRNNRWSSRGKLPEAMMSDAERESGNSEIYLSETILNTYSLYCNSGWAYPYPFRMTINEHDILGIRVVRDGSDGLLEIFDLQGKRIASAYTSSTGIAWRPISILLPSPPEDELPLVPPDITRQYARQN